MLKRFYASSRPALCSGKDAILKHNKQAGFGYLGLHCMLEALTPPRDSRPEHAPPSRRVQEKKRKFFWGAGPDEGCLLWSF